MTKRGFLIKLTRIKQGKNIWNFVEDNIIGNN